MADRGKNNGSPPQALRILSEDRLSLKAAARKLRVTYTTISKYAKRGCSVRRNGSSRIVVLESIKTNGSRVETSVQAIERFVSEINAQ